MIGHIRGTISPVCMVTICPYILLSTYVTVTVHETLLPIVIDVQKMPFPVV